MADEVEIKLKVTGDTAGADAVAKSVDKVTGATEKAAKQNQTAAKTLHEVKEGQEAVKDAAEGLSQALDSNLLSALVNVTKAIRGFAAAGLAGAVGAVIAVVTTAIGVWSRYKEEQQAANDKIAEAKLRAEELAQAAKQRLQEEAAKSFKAWAEAVEQSAQKAIEAMERARGMADTLADANAEIEIANIDSDPSLSADQKERAKIAVRARSTDQKLARKDRALESEQDRERGEISKLERHQQLISDQIRSAGENSEQGKMLQADWRKLQEERLQREKRIEEIEKERETVDRQRAAADAKRGAEEKGLDQKESERRGKEVDEHMKELGDTYRKERATRKQIAEDIKQSDIDDLYDQAERDKKKREQQAKAKEELEDIDVPEFEGAAKGQRERNKRTQQRKDLEESINRKGKAAGLTDDEIAEIRDKKLNEFDESSRGRRSRPGAPNVSPETGNTDFKEALKPRGIAPEAGSSLNRSAQSSDELSKKVAETGGKIESALNTAAGAIEGLGSRVSNIESRLANMATLNTSSGNA